MTDRTRPRLSVVIPTRDRADFLERTLACLVPQTLAAGRFEVIVVDDGSRDGTKTVARRYARRLPLRYFRRPGGNAGAARNLGARRARGSLILFMDDECLVRPDFLESHCRAHERLRRPSVLRGPTSPVLSRWDRAALSNVKASRKPVSTRSEGWLFSVEELELGRFQPLFPIASTKRLYHEALRLFGTGLSGCTAPWVLFLTRNVSLPKALLEPTGGFDEDLPAAGLEDLELGYRLHRQGAPYALEPKAACFYQVCEVSKRGKALRLAEHYRRICAKHEDFGVFQVWKLLTGALDLPAFEAAVAGFRRLERERPAQARRRLAAARRGAELRGQDPDYLFRNL